jgi:Ca2+-transporting ATPase
MVWAVLGSAVLVLIVTYLPFIQPIFNTVSLGLSDWLLMVPCILLASAAAEITKIFIRTKAARTVNTTV